MKVTGMLISSEVYSEHPDLDNIESAMGAAVIIHTMTWSSAESVEEGKAGRISLKDWSSPLNPSEAVDLSSLIMKMIGKLSESSLVQKTLLRD